MKMSANKAHFSGIGEKHLSEFYPQAGIEITLLSP